MPLRAGTAKKTTVLVAGTSPNPRSVLKYEVVAGSITPFSDLAKEYAP